jgi:uncharacterized protein (TIGR02145 family)
MKKIIMNSLTFFGLILLLSINVYSQEIITDNRDTQQYRIIIIGTQTWMAENLNFETENSWTYGNSKRNAKKFGRLYSFDAAMTACPAGWHLPSQEEWQELINFYGGDNEAGLALRIDGHSPFNAKYGGFMSADGEFLDLGHNANYWTSTVCDDQDAWRCFIDRGFSAIVQNYFSKKGGLSVRCIKSD